MIEAEAQVVDGAGEGEEDGTNRLDPFVQPPILKALFEQLSVEDLGRCRLVSKLWCDESLSTWRSKATLKFRKEGIVSTRDDGSKSTTSLGEFLELWEAEGWGSCPFKKFSLEVWKFKAEDVEQKRFLELVGGHVTSLTLEGCSFVGRDNFQRVIYQAFPKLQFLKMEACWDWVERDGDETDESEEEDGKEEILVYQEPAFGVHGLKSLSLDLSWNIKDTMMDMLSHFHKLASLHMTNLAEYRTLLEIIRLIRAQDQTKLPLKNFDVRFYLKFGKETASSMKLLKLHEQLNLPLQHIEIFFIKDKDVDRNFSNGHVIRDILQHHSSTLKYLEFSGGGGDQDGLWNQFPFGIQLKKLETLFMSTYLSDNFNYLKHTPNLRVLEIGDYSDSMAESDDLFSNSAELEIGDWTLPSLTDLSVLLPLYPCEMLKLMKWMPNVERFEGAELDDVTFSMVCKNWKNLKELEDYGWELTDKGVIGTGNAHEDGGDVEESQIGPNIIQLKYLTSFVTSSSKLTSASVRDGFSKLANLKELSVGHYTKLDGEAKAALQRQKIRLNIRPM